MEKKKGIRQSVQAGQIHLVKGQDGEVWLATKEGACWVGEARGIGGRAGQIETLGSAPGPRGR